jgi:hypothetical protein
MGLLSSIFGGAQKTKYEVGGAIANVIEHVLLSQGVETLENGSILLDRNMNISFRDGHPARGGNVIAVTDLFELEEFDSLSNLFSSGDPELAEMMMETIGSRFVDRVAYAVMANFETQSDEFARLPAGQPYLP